MWNVMCNVSKVEIDIDNKFGWLYTPEMNYPDMSSTIRCFKRVDPRIEGIVVIVGGIPDIAYRYDSDDHQWHAHSMKGAEHALR
jgi:hypothetical protein